MAPDSWSARLFRDTSYSMAILAGLVVLGSLGGLLIATVEWNALFLCISLLASIFILLDFRIGVSLLIVLMPVSASTVFPHSIAGITGLNPVNLLLLSTLLSCLIYRAGQNGFMSLVPKALIWRYALPLIVAGLIGMNHAGEIPSLFRANNLIDFDSASTYLRDMLIKPLFMILFGMLVAAAVPRSKHLESFLTPMLLAVWCMGLLTIVFVYLSGATFSELASSNARAFFAPLGMHANDLGRCYAIAYALMLFTFAATTDYRLRLLLLASMGMIVVALVLTFSRGAFLGFAIVNLLFLVSRRKIVTLLIAGLLFAGLLFLLPGAVFERLGTGWDSGLNAISAGRVDEIWLPLLPEIWTAPVFGHGLGSILWSDAMRAGRILEVTHPHNAYLQAGLDMGLLGLGLLCTYFLHVWHGFRSLSNNMSLSPARRGFYEGAAVGLLAYLITAFAGSSLTPVPEQSFLWLAIGMMYGEPGSQNGERHV